MMMFSTQFPIQKAQVFPTHTHTHAFIEHNIYDIGICYGIND